MKVLFLITALGLSACKMPWATSKSISIDPNLVACYLDVRLAEISFANTPEKSKEAINVILAQHRLSRGAFDNLLKELKQNPDGWVQFQEEVLKQSQKMEPPVKQ